MITIFVTQSFGGRQLSELRISILIVVFGISNTSFKSKMILRRLGGGDEAYYTYVEEADTDANKNSALI